MKIFIIGKIRGENRSQNLLKVFKKHESLKIYEETKVSIFKSQRLNNLLYFFSFLFFVDLFRAARCNKVIYLAMNQNKLFFLLLLKMIRKEVILDFYTSRLFFASKAGKIDNSSANFHRLNHWYLYYVDKLRLFLPTKVIFLNPSHAEYLSNKFYVPGLVKKSIVIPLVVPDYGFSEIKSKHDYFNVCWWGKASHYHGLEYMMQELSAAYLIKPQLRFYFFDDSEARKQILQILAKKSGLASNCITISGDLTFRSGLADWLKVNCDLALGSFRFLHGANLGIANKALESWSLGLPICTQATLDISIDNITGAYLDEPIKGELCSLIVEASERNTLRGIPMERIADNAREVFISIYSVSAFEKSIMDIINS